MPTLKENDKICVIIDATYFSKRNDWLLLIRSDNQINLVYKFISSESQEVMNETMDLFDSCWYYNNTKAFIIDWRKFMFSLLKKRYPNKPIQMCIFHMKSIIKRYVTLKPKTRLWKALHILKSLLWNVSEKTFNLLFTTLEIKYSKFLKQKNYNWEYEHRRLRSVMRSIRYYLPYLYTYEHHKELDIPRTTWNCDWYFSHIKDKLRIHRWLTRENRNKLIIFLLENSNRKAIDLD